LLVILGICGCQSRQLYKDSRVMMGTFVEVTSPDKDSAEIIYSEISRVEKLLSKYDPESEVSRLNVSGELSVSPETFQVIQRSKEFWQLSGGAFDITVGPLMDLWGFTDKAYRLPKEDEIRAALGLAGVDKIILNPEKNMVKLSFSGMKIDLGGAAKGYAVDCAVIKLRERGIKSCLINAGGQIYCLGDNFGKPWKIAIREPRGGRLGEYLELKDKAVSTSGDYEQFFIEKDKRYSHIINPLTGYPANSGIASVTVIADDGMTADALSTAIFILGSEKGLELAKRFKNVEVKITRGHP